MRTEVFYSSSEDHPGYGADADDTERIESNNSSQIQKSLVASVLSQGDKKKITGKAMETMASRVMNSNKYSVATKSLAASVLSQSDNELMNKLGDINRTKLIFLSFYSLNSQKKLNND